MIRRIHLLLLVCIVTGCIFISCNSSSDSDKESNDETLPSLFESSFNADSLAFTIRTDIQQLIDNKEVEGNSYQEAMLTGMSMGNQIFQGEINIRPRGITRKSRCNFPPLMLQVKKTQREELQVGKSENIKLVTYCKDSIGYQDWIKKEYLAYKLYNSLEEYSFRVKLVEVSYEDSKGQHPTIQRTGFIIEPLEELAERFDCDIVPDEQAIKSIHKEKYKLLTAFQYMIGNSDWNFSNRHNIRLLQCKTDSSPIPVPYDFDYSGLVNADYATPHPMLPIKKVTERIFQWRGSADEDFSATMQVFQDKRPVLEGILKQEGLLSNETLSEAENYFDEFFQNIISPEVIKKEIEKARG